MHKRMLSEIGRMIIHFLQPRITILLDSYLSSFCSYLMKILAMLKLDPALLRPLQDHQRGATGIPRKAVGSSRVQNGKCNAFDQLGCVLPWLPVIHLPGPRKRAEIRPGWREIGTLGGSGRKASRTGEKSGDTKVCMSMGFAYGFEFCFYHIGDIGEAYIVLCSRFHFWLRPKAEARPRQETFWSCHRKSQSRSPSDKSSLVIETPDRKWSPAKYRQGYGKWLQIVQTAPRWPWKSWKRRVYLKACPQ